MQIQQTISVKHGVLAASVHIEIHRVEQGLSILGTDSATPELVILGSLCS